MSNFELIVAIINKDYASNLMEAAREAGAKGGTILNARGTGDHNVEKLFGLTLQQEKEVVLILTEIKHKVDIMKSVIETAGLNTLGRGICFSMPVEDVIGTTFSTLEDKKE
ncbi:MAG: P-II family nitrogen regulator [Clostridia bacterium]|nr:P-II family nitrogen regulator [Clostridia bacterium]